MALENLKAELYRQVKGRKGEPDPWQLQKIQESVGHEDEEPLSDTQRKNEKLVALFPAIKQFRALSTDWLRGATETPRITNIPMMNVPDFQKVDCDQILDTLIARVRERHAGRYGDFLKSDAGLNAKALLWKALTEPVREACEAGNFELARLKSFGGEPQNCKEAGIYLHILWKKDNPGQFWLYVGQAINFRNRIIDHEDPDYRAKHTSLHYYIWDNIECLESYFVMLAVFQEAQPEHRHFLLNLAEMWMALVLQTLRVVDLDKYLPETTPKPWAGLHLNVAPPIWQRFPGEVNDLDSQALSRETFLEALYSSDPIKKQWAEELRDSYHNLRDSPDKRLREYYYGNMMRMLDLSRDAWNTKKLQIYHEFLNGVDRQVKASKGTLKVYLNDFALFIHRDLCIPVEDGDWVHVQLFLTDTTNPLRYAQKAEPTDPSSRLLVLIKQSDQLQAKTGKNFHGWLATFGDMMVNRMNFLVDILEGFAFEESATFPRRTVRRKIGGSRSTIHTGEA